MADKVQLKSPLDQIRAQDRTWLTLGELREVVKRADAHGWTDACLVSHGSGGGDHPHLRNLRCATVLVVEGPS